MLCKTGLKINKEVEKYTNTWPTQGIGIRFQVGKNRDAGQPDQKIKE